MRYFYHNSAFDGIVIEKVEYDIEDKVVFRYFNGTDLAGILEYSTKLCKAKIRQDKMGNDYFVSRGNKYYINEFMRENYPEI